MDEHDICQFFFLFFSKFKEIAKVALRSMFLACSLLVQQPTMLLKHVSRVPQLISLNSKKYITSSLSNAPSLMQPFQVNADGCLC